jgi:hypothetical protein
MITRSDALPVDAQRDVLPLFAVDLEAEQIQEFLGTSFLIGGLLVTCWHCVSDALASDSTVVVATFKKSGYAPHEIRRLERDANGADLAIGEVDLLPSIGFELSSAEGLALGSDVWTYGYPLTRPPNERRNQWMMEGRFLQGYVTRHFYHSDDQIRTYELDMRAPAGLSGAPIVGIPSRRVAGVVYGVNEVSKIEHFASVDPATGERTPELQRLESFALALDTETLRNSAAAATNHLPLCDFLRDREEEAQRALDALYGRRKST